MLTELKISGFRRFDSYEMRDIARVTLLTGDNNCGKTTLMEAMHFLVAADARASLRNVAFRRGEVEFIPAQDPERQPHEAATLRHFFHGYQFAPGASFRVCADQHERKLSVSDFGNGADPHFIEPYTALCVTITDSKCAELNDRFGCTSDGAFTSHRFSRGPDTRRSAEDRLPPSLFVTGEIGANQLRHLWDDLIAARRENLVIEALNIIDAELTDLVFEAAPLGARNMRVGALFGHKQHDHRVPVGSFGDGMIHLLGIGASLAFCRGGTLFIDEIDTGIHWSRLAEMWRLVIETAREHETQVIATTHSQDCLNGLAWVCETYPELAADVSVQTIDPALEESVSLEGERLPFVLNQQIEVR